ncbi:hypothetical protein ACFLR2_02400, partial [Chlamydiota bacterium]
APFDYDLNRVSVAGTNGRTMICLHGYGSNFKIAYLLKNVTDSTLVSFNFPDHDIKGDQDHREAAFGTIRELLPAIYVLKQCVLDEGLSAVDLYGFSAGGGVAVNLIGVLNSTSYDKELSELGIGAEEKTKLLDAIQKGVVILDVPLKSMDEIIDLRGSSESLEMVAAKYRTNHFRPLDSLERLQGLSLHVILYFQEPDEIIFNRDDALYIERLKQANAQGITEVVIENEGGHSALHTSLWQCYTSSINGLPAASKCLVEGNKVD